MGSRTACWLLLALAAADVLELKVDDDLAVQARAEFAKFEQVIAPADAVLDWAERSAYREQVSDEEFAASWVYATESSEDEAGLDEARFERFVSAVDAFAKGFGAIAKDRRVALVGKSGAGKKVESGTARVVGGRIGVRER